MMPAPWSDELRWRVIVCPYSSAFSDRGLIFLGVCKRKVERYISKFLLNSDVKLEPVGFSYSSISFAPCEERIVFGYQIWKPQPFRSFNPPFGNPPFTILSDNVPWNKCIQQSRWTKHYWTMSVKSSECILVYLEGTHLYINLFLAD